MRSAGSKLPKARVRAARGRRGKRTSAGELELERGSASDVVFVRGLRVDTIVGVNSWERLKRQPVVIDLALELDTRAAAASDHLRDALDYAEVASGARELVAASRCRLIERLAELVAAHCLRDPRVTGVRVRVEKPWALRDGAIAGVEISRARRAK